jgi:hypothetical protein
MDGPELRISRCVIVSESAWSDCASLPKPGTVANRGVRANCARISTSKTYIQALTDRSEVDDHAIRIFGDKATLEQVDAGQASAVAGSRLFTEVARHSEQNY